ncbi:hypothetical protein V6N12_053613 [Hibiscus sabdariffa]|uniref:Terpene synthase N-terminal domain-containing protein n=1 Tax=Hibiscus sabdariffa TaxID=183260 RepID=A0ABR2D833_9ROSI
MDVDAAIELQFEELKEQVRKMIVEPIGDLNQKLPWIDAVQRLGVSYHFEKEIEDELEKIYHDMKTNDVETDLYTTALRFRLLREHGYRVSCEAFNKFKDEEGNFKASLTSDVNHALKQTIRRGLPRVEARKFISIHNNALLQFAKIDFNLLQLLHRKELSEICRWWKDLDLDFTRATICKRQSGERVFLDCGSLL